tara:strand:+ start:252 stop:518 length:267 start_codon:yes stop_codon:yes gene_type:complete
MTTTVKLKKIFAIDADSIPQGSYDENDTWIESEIAEAANKMHNGEFPWHYDDSIVRIPDDGNAFSVWLVERGFDFEGKPSQHLAVWGS